MVSGESPPSHGGRAELEAALEQEEARLRKLEKEKADAAAHAAELRAKLNALDVRSGVITEQHRPAAAAPRSPTEKVRLFRQLFRGRDDLYPTRFVSKKTGKPGYAPACSNKFVAGVCELPKVKCGDCTNQAFRPVDDAAVLGRRRRPAA
jgi:hypothetical protein